MGNKIVDNVLRGDPINPNDDVGAELTRKERQAVSQGFMRDNCIRQDKRKDNDGALINPQSNYLPWDCATLGQP